MRYVSLGLDVSRDRMGWGVADVETGAAIACGTKGISPPGVRGRKPDGYDERRPGLVRQGIEAIDFELRSLGAFPSLVTLEAPYVAASGQATVALGLAVGSAWQYAGLVWRGASLGFMQPGDWKRDALVPPDPKVGRKALKGAALRSAVCEVLDEATARRLRALPLTGLKPWPMVTAWGLGFEPDGQDAADAGCIAVARQRVNAAAFA